MGTGVLGQGSDTDFNHVYNQPVKETLSSLGPMMTYLQYVESTGRRLNKMRLFSLCEEDKPTSVGNNSNQDDDLYSRDEDEFD